MSRTLVAYGKFTPTSRKLFRPNEEHDTMIPGMTFTPLKEDRAVGQYGNRNIFTLCENENCRANCCK